MHKRVIATATVIAALLAAGPAQALFHAMDIDQVFFGTDQAPGAQFIQLRMTMGSQNFVSGQDFPTDNADISSAGSFGAFDHNVSNSASGSAILAGTQQAQDLFCLSMDQIVEGALFFPDGRVCYSGRAGACVSYGNFSGSNPAPQPSRGSALRRVAAGDVSATAFALQAPAPVNNAGHTGQIDGLPGDPDGTGDVDIEAEARILFAVAKRCDLPANQRGADANIDTRINVADVVQTILLVATPTA